MILQTESCFISHQIMQSSVGTDNGSHISSNLTISDQNGIQTSMVIIAKDKAIFPTFFFLGGGGGGSRGSRILLPDHQPNTLLVA